MHQFQAVTDHSHTFKFEAFDKNGVPLWTEELKNLVVNTGLDDILDKFYKGSAYTAAHYIGLTAGTPTIAAADTMSSHTGWTEQTGYNEAARQAFVPGTVASQSVSNSGSVAVFTITSAATTIGGGFLTTVSTKGGTTGTLIGAVAFSGGDRVLGAGDTLQVTVTATAASA